MVTPVLLVLLGALSRLIPHPPNFAALGALALYSGARLPRRFAWAVPLAAMALSDFVLDFGTGRRVVSLMRLTIYGTFAAIVFAGRVLRVDASPGAPGGDVGLRVGPLLPDLESGRVLAGSDVPEDRGGPPALLRGGDPVLLEHPGGGPAGDGGVVLGRRVGASSAERRRGAMAAAALRPRRLPPRAGTLSAQNAPSTSESVVVTATSVAEDEKEIGSASTVITRAEIEKRETAVVSDLLRTVPGLDVVQLGTPGSQTSLFTRGTNSTQTLVLVDGARMNSPFFAGYDWSGMTTENVERIEVVRGPFSALYGSDAIGGVVQVFTRSPGQGISGRATGEVGNQGSGRGSGSFAIGEGVFGATGSYSYTAFDGDRPNTDWRQRNGSARLEARLSEGSRIAVEGSVLDGEVGNAGAVGSPFASPTARGLFREERIAVPGAFALSDSNHLDVLFASVRSKPGFVRRGIRVADRRADAAGASRGHRPARRPPALGLRVLGALEGRRRVQLRAQHRGRAHDDLGHRGAGRLDPGRVHRHGRPALRPQLRLRRGVEPPRHDLVVVGEPALEGPLLGRHRLPRADGGRALLSLQRQPGPEAGDVASPGSSAPSTTSATKAAWRSRSSGTT